MAAINWNQMAVPDFKAANALLLSGQDQFNTAIGQAGKVVTDYQAANTKNNTQAIMNALQSAKSPEEYQAALESAQAIAATKSGDFDQDKFNAARLTQPGVLDAQQQQQLELEDRPILLQINQGLLEGKKREDLAPLYGQLKSITGRSSGATAGQQAFTNTEALKDSELALRNAVSAETSANAAAKAANLKEQEALAKDYRENEGGTTYMDAATGEWRTTNTVDFKKGGAPSGGGKSGSSFTPNRSGTPLQQLTESVAFAESGGKETDDKGNYTTNTKSGAKGKMQVLDSTNRDPGFGVVPAKDNSPEERTRVGRDYLSAMVNRYPGDTASALGAYNWGVGNMDSYLKTGHGLKTKANPTGAMPKETKDYIAKISGYMSGVNSPNPSDAASTIATGKVPKANIAQEINSRIAPIVGTKAIQGYQGDLTTTLRNINTQSGIKEEKGDTATNEANEAKYMSKNKPGIIQAMFNLNSGSKRQRSIAEQVDGFNLLPSKTRLAIMEKVSAENNSETFKYWSSLGEDELRAKFASSVKKAMDTEVPGLSLKRQVAVENAVTKFNKDNVWGRNGAPSPYAQLVTVIGSEDKADAFIRTYPDSDLSKSILGSSPNGAPTPAQAANTIAAPTPGKPTVVPKPIVPVVPRTPEDTPLGVRAIQGIGGVLGNIRDTTSPSSIAASLFRGGSDATREAANKLKYGSLYPYMKANNDPRLKN